MRYQDVVASLLDTFVTSRKETPEDIHFASIFDALGCTTIARLRSGSAVFIKEPEQPDTRDEICVVAALVQVMHAYVWRRQGGSVVDGLSILSGLVKNHRWRACLYDADTAFDFAVLLTIFLSHPPATREGQTILGQLTSPALLILNEWLAPETPFDALADHDMFTMRVAALMFGETWLYLADVTDAGAIVDVLRSDKPPVRQSLLLCEAPPAAALPTLDAS